MKEIFRINPEKIYPWWRFPCRVKTLLLTDGSLDFGPGDFGLSTFVSILKNDGRAYVDFDIPWNLNLGFNMRYTHSLNSDPRFVQSLQASGDLSVSEKWKITYSSGYDFENKAFTQTNVGISRDLHCWTMNLNWVPFGRFQSYFFVIAVKASMLQDLKLERRKPWFDNL